MSGSSRLAQKEREVAATQQWEKNRRDSLMGSLVDTVISRMSGDEWHKARTTLIDHDGRWEGLKVQPSWWVPLDTTVEEAS